MLCLYPYPQCSLLTALWELPNTNLALYHEITSRDIKESTGVEDDFPEEEDEPIAYGSIIPMEVITAQIVGGGSINEEGFKVVDDGSICADWHG